MVHTYYLDLIEFVGGIVFLVVFKVVMLIGMNKMSILLSDDPKQEPKPHKPKLRRDLDLLRWGVIGLLTLAAVWQIRPDMLFVTSGQLVSAGLLPGVAHWWVANALWLNIWSIVIELLFAGMLLSFPGPLAVRITSMVLIVYSVVVWVFLQGTGHVLSQEPSFLGGAPGTALLMAVCLLPLVFQERSYRSVFALSVGVYWALFTLFQWLPSNHFWSGQGYRVLAAHEQDSLPGALSGMASSVLTAFSHASVPVTVGLGGVALLIAVGVVLRGQTWILMASAILSLALWVFVEGLGFGGGTVFALGAAPFIVVFSWLARMRRRDSAAIGEGVST